MLLLKFARAVTPLGAFCLAVYRSLARNLAQLAADYVTENPLNRGVVDQPQQLKRRGCAGQVGPVSHDGAQNSTAYCLTAEAMGHSGRLRRLAGRDHRARRP